MSRPDCPLCGSPRRRDDWEMTYLVPDGWPNPAKNTVCLCLDCGMIYYDNDMTQADYDEYYRRYYGYDGNEHSENNLKRLDEIAELAASYAQRDDLIVDFGGGDDYLASRLRAMGYPRAMTVNVGEEIPKGVDLLIASQVMEHLYDLRPITQRLVNSLSYKGKLLIEVPNCLRMASVTDVPILDYHQKHVNHFTPQTLDKLFKLYDFGPEYTHIGSTPGYFGQHYRAVYVRHLAEVNYNQARMVVHDRVANRLPKLQAIDYPVIVWGCGDLCLHMLSMVNLDIAYYVDNDPAFKDATIQGIPVRDKVTSGEPIVVIAQNQATGILKRIKQDGLQNRIIQI